MKTLLLTLLSSIALAKAADPISFKGLAAGETVSVRVESSGCFHNEVYELEFKRGEGITVDAISISEDPAKPGIEKRKVVHTAKLNAEQIASLDRLLAFYREDKKGGCTTVEGITIQRKAAGGKAVAAENYVDATCSKKEVTTFASLMYAAEKKTD